MIAYEYFCNCVYEDVAPQPEGGVLFSQPPKKGEKFMLPSSGYTDEWEVLSVNHREMTFEAKQISNE